MADILLPGYREQPYERSHYQPLSYNIKITGGPLLMNNKKLLVIIGILGLLVYGTNVRNTAAYYSYTGFSSLGWPGTSSNLGFGSSFGNSGGFIGTWYGNSSGLGSFGSGFGSYGSSLGSWGTGFGGLTGGFGGLTSSLGGWGTGFGGLTGGFGGLGGYTSPTGSYGGFSGGFGSSGTWGSISGFGGASGDRTASWVTPSGSATFDPYGTSGTSGYGSGSYRYGCTDSRAINYDPLATIDNGSCQYPASSSGSGDFAEPSEQERSLHRLINEYRSASGLPAIPLSKSLTVVAQIHAQDLDTNPPEGSCNMHSWSDSGSWTSCCYTPDHAQAACMWNKPRELTNYSGVGYEISYMHSWAATPSEALAGWKSSSGHNSVIMNLGTWASINWRSVGVGIFGNYAVVWFGEETDPAGYWN